MSKADQLRAELRVAELEEALIAAKDDDSVTSEQKDELREARRVFREMRESAPPEDGVARPAAVKAKGEVN